jgi:hypothetical protein
MTRFAFGSMVLCAAVAAHAQPTKQYASHPVAPAAESYDAAYRASMGQMRSDLRNLITAQELYQTGNHAFAGDIDLLPTFKPIPGAHVEIVTAGANGWAAVESMPTNAASGKSCVIWVGSVANGDRPSTEAEHKTFPEAEVACDGDGLHQRAEWAAAAQSYMTFALKKLAKSEEKYLALNGHYTTDASSLEPFVWDPGVSIAIVSATDAGWAAKASFAGFPGKTCVMWRGELDASQLGRTVDRDQVACDAL